MKLVYSKSRCNQADIVHRFDVLGEFLPSDLDVVKNSLQFFFNQLEKSAHSSRIVVLDFSESAIKINENKLQVFVSEMKAIALASQIFMSIAQSDIESMHAEQKAREQSMLNQINLLENKLNLVESIKTQIQQIQTENETLRDELKKSSFKGSARSFFEKLWGDS